MEAASKVSRSKSPKRKNKSVDAGKLKQSCPNVRRKLGASFESLKKSTADTFAPHLRKEKENKESLFLKKKKMVYTYLKS
jgi:hypothetical protein